MDAGIEVKVEPYDGTYECLFCGESVRGQAALKCWQCNSNPFHRACDSQSRYAEVCPTCGWKTVEEWTGAAGCGTAAPGVMIDLTALGAGEDLDAEAARVTERGAREDAVRAVGGTVVAADEVGRGEHGGQADAGGGSSGKGKEIAWAEAGLEAAGDGVATSAGARSTTSGCTLSL